MNRLVRSIGLWPLVLASVTLLALATAELGRLSARDETAHSAVPLVWTEVPDEWLDGLERLREGDAPGAQQLLRLAESHLDEAPSSLLRARLAAALLAADGIDAEATVEKLALRSSAEPLRAFVLGLAEFARCQLAGRQAKLPGGDPGAFDRAIRTATASARAFQTASLLHEGREWPLARRNAERVLAVRQELVREQEKQKRDQQREQDKQEPEPKIEPQRIEDELPRPELDAMLSPSELQALLQRLAAAENEKRGARRAARDARSTAVEQDW